MSLLEWTDECSVGVPILDKHHKKIHSLIGELGNSQLPVYSERFHQILKELLDYSTYHFKYEEDLLDQCGYPCTDRDKHLKEHEDFIEDITEFLLEAVERNPELPARVLKFLEIWMYHHIMKSDKQYQPFLQDYLYGQASPDSAS